MLATADANVSQHLTCCFTYFNANTCRLKVAVDLNISVIVKTTFSHQNPIKTQYLSAFGMDKSSTLAVFAYTTLTERPHLL